MATPVLSPRLTVSTLNIRIHALTLLLTVVAASAAPQITLEQPAGVPLTSVAVWGINSSGEQNVPGEFNGAKAVAAGSNHILVLRRDNTVAQWGTGIAPPPSNLTGVTSIAAGTYHSLAVKSDGSLVAWGNNDHGQTTVPAGLTGVLSTSGYDHTLVLQTDHTVIGWGNNSWGQIAPPPGLAGVLQTAATVGGSLALMSDGTVTAWGVPPIVVGAAGLSGIKAIAGGELHALAVRNNGTVAAWGTAGSGRLDVPVGLNNVTAVAAGRDHSVALRGDGTLTVWGNYPFFPAPDATSVLSISAKSFLTAAVVRGVDFRRRRTAETTSKTITLTNSGDAPLTVSSVSLAGETPEDFTLLTGGLLTSIPPGGSSSFILNFKPIALGPTKAIVRIISNDGDEGTLDFSVRGIGIVAPEIDITGNGQPVLSGNMDPQALNHTHFGSTPVTGGSVTRTFTIFNNGPDPLNLTGSPNRIILDDWTDFTVITQPPASIAPHSSATFQIQFDPTRAGILTTGARIPNNDFDEAPFTFVIRGEGLPQLPVVNTPAYNSLSPNSVRLGAILVSNGGVSLTARGIVYSQTAVNSNPVIGGTGVTVNNFGSGGSLGPFETGVYDLTPGTAYSFKAYATNPAGTAYTATGTFTTLPPAAPTVGEPSASELSYTSAKVTARITATGGSTILSRSFVYSPTSQNSDPLPGGPGVTQIAFPGTSSTFTTTLNGLSPGTAYSWKAFATNSGGTGFTSPVSTFTTLTVQAPSVSSPVSSEITATAARAGGTVTAENGAPVTERGVVYALTTANNNPAIGGTGVIKVTTGGTTGPFLTDLTGLTTGAGYSWKAFAVNSAGTGYSAAATLTTTGPTPPVVTGLTVSGVTAGTATLSGNILTDGGSPVTERGIVISASNTKPFTGGAGVIKTTATGTSGAFSVNASGLAPGTAYTCKGYATNSTGTGYTTAFRFTTAGGAAPQITVTTSVDENDSPAGTAISLREAVRDAASGAVIGFAPQLDGHAITLLHGEITLDGKTVNIDASRLLHGIVVDGRLASRHFNVISGGSLSLTALTLQRGRAPDAGGSILCDGTLSLTDCTLRDNAAASGVNGTPGRDGRGPSAPGGVDAVLPTGGSSGTGGHDGGAIFSALSMHATRCRFFDNRAGSGGFGGAGGSTTDPEISRAACGGSGGFGGGGGAISSEGELVLVDCVFDGNLAGAGGGGGPTGIGGNFTGGGFSLCSASTGGEDGAGADSGDGGAVKHTGSLTASGCAFTNNQCFIGGAGINPGNSSVIFARGGSGGSGGALFLNTSLSLLENCTLSGNSISQGFMSGGASGGGIRFIGNFLRMVHCTVTGNQGLRLTGDANWNLGEGAGVSSSGSAEFYNCLIAANIMDRGVGAKREENTAGSGTLTFFPPSPFPNYTSGGPAAVNPLLSALTVSGGESPVHLLLPASPALDTGTAVVAAAAFDQRGLPRPVNALDLGAMEMQAAEPGSLSGQRITSLPPASVKYSGAPLSYPVSATTSAGLPATLEVVTGPATLANGILTVNGAGFVTVRAAHAGSASRAAAPDVTCVIRVQFIPLPGDDDGDGIDNLVEAALQLNPAGPDAPPLVLQRLANGDTRAVLARRPHLLEGWQIDIETSSDLSNWIPVTGAIVTPTADSAFDRVEVAVPQTVSKRFMRIKVTSPL